MACCITAVLLTGCGTAAPAASPSPSATRTGYQGRAVTGAAEPGAAPVPARPPTGRVVALPKDTRPWGVVVAPSVGKVYLAPRHRDGLTVVDLATEKARTVPTPGSARMIDLAGPDGPLLLPAEDKATLYRLALPSLKVVESVPTRNHPHQAVAVGATTFVSEEFGHAVGVIRGGRRIAELTQPVQPGGITAVAGRVAAVDVATSTLFVYDATSLKLLAALPAGAGPSHVVPVGGSRVAVCDVRGRAVLTYDLAGTPRALGRAAVPGRAFWLAADPATATVYAALPNTNLVAKVHVGADGAPTLVSTVPTVRQPVSMDLDPDSGTLYIGGYADSTLQIVPTSAFG